MDLSTPPSNDGTMESATTTTPSHSHAPESSQSCPLLMDGKVVSRNQDNHLKLVDGSPSEAKSFDVTSASKSATVSPFFDKLPVEIRNEIYRLLLVNPALGRTELHLVDLQEVKYELAVQILYTCKQTYEEGSRILYSDNTFSFACLEAGHYSQRPCGEPICPLLRYPSTSSPIPATYSELPLTAPKVRRWKILLTAHISGARCFPAHSLVHLCRAISRSQPQSLEVLIIPEDVECPSSPNSTYEDINTVLRPFKLLRGILPGGFVLRDAHLDEVPSYNIDNWSSRNRRRTLKSNLPSPPARRNIVCLLESDLPVEFTSEMCPGLLRYAQSFERYTPFKRDMNSRGWVSIEQKYCGIYVSNPFPCREYHPVEQGVTNALRTVDTRFSKLVATVWFNTWSRNIEKLWLPRRTLSISSKGRSVLACFLIGELRRLPGHSTFTQLPRHIYFWTSTLQRSGEMLRWIFRLR